MLVFFEMKNGKSQLESKRDYKQRMGAIQPKLGVSPDKADSEALALQSAIINFGFKLGAKKHLPHMGVTDEKMKVHLMEKHLEQEKAVKERRRRPEVPMVSFGREMTGRRKGLNLV